MSNKPNKQLRFASLIRVSTEQQEQYGESLRTQRAQNKRDVGSLSGVIVEWYGGQEHATPGWEKKEIDRLVADASKGKFDAVIVTNADRWSRDNEKSQAGLDEFKKHRVRFFVGVTEYDLFNPNHGLFLEMSVAFGKFSTRDKIKRGIINRLARNKRGIPAVGKTPFGRVWDKDKQEWTVDQAKQAMIIDVAERYLRGESLPKLAQQYGVNHSNLCKVLRERCGTEWKVSFDVAELNIHETATLIIPRLLPEKTIRAVRQRLEANKTYLHGNPKHDYLLSGRVFCAACGGSLCGEPKPKSHKYYRHSTKACSLKPRPRVRADAIEEAVVADLFKMLGNPAEIERAVKAAIPDCDKALKQQEQLRAELEKIERARGRILNLIEDDAMTQGQAATKLRELKDREASLQAELDKVAATLADLPDAETVRVFVEKCDDGFLFLHDQYGERRLGGNDLSTWMSMTRQDRRHLVESVFAAPMPDGRPPGVYLTPAGGELHGPKNFTYQLVGRLIGGVTPRALY